jgi:hypothetical protein
MLTLTDSMPESFTGRVAGTVDFRMEDEDGRERYYRQAWDFVGGRMVGSGVMRSSAVLYRTDAC